MYDLETVRANFDGIAYAKGASVLQQLITFVGIDNFVAGLKKYFEKHAWGNTILQDLIVEIEATSGRDLKPWISTWLQTAGVNTLRPELAIDGDTYTSVAVKQEAPLVPAGSTELRPHRLSIGLYDIDDAALNLRKRVEFDADGALTDVPALAGEKVADLLFINDADLSYGKIRFDARGIKTLTTHLGSIKDPLARAVAWSAVWDMTRDGELAASDYLPLVLNALAPESDVAVATVQLAQLVSTVELYGSDKNRETLRAELADGLEKLLDKTEPGSDLQLQYLRSFSSAAHTPAQLARVRAALNGEIAGVTVDANLRWSLLAALVERGLADLAEIEAEFERDQSADGRKHAAMCRAAIPAADAKAAAWKLAAGTDVSNHIMLQTLAGFNRPRHRDLTAPYADIFFAEISEYWDTHNFDIAQKYVVAAFPTFQVSQETLAKAEKWLAGPGVSAPNGLRRAVAEQRDGLIRSLKAQAKDA
jgi:aminopeptidase N